MSKKRTRELPSVNASLVEIWEDLAHQDEEVRLKAAHRLLTKHLPTADLDQRRTILKRLFRGLCSGRKAARLGFSIALTEVLVHSFENESSITSSEILDILESSTTSDGSTTGQDDRDHYFGRVFGCDAVIKSRIFLTKSQLPHWQRCLDLICGVAVKKPWLRQECGWILYQCVNTLSVSADLQAFIAEIIQKLIQHKLIRTPEGVPIWIAASRTLESLHMPRNVWKYDDPLAKKDLQTLAQVLKDAKPSSKDDADFKVQGSASWSAQLHFAWEVVLSELLKPGADKRRASFAEFWQAVVDDGLFAPTNSRERKHWGFLLLQKVILAAPPTNLGRCFSRNVTSCLVQSLKADDRYLQKGAQRVFQSLRARSQKEPFVASASIVAILKIAEASNVDILLKNKIFDQLFANCSAAAFENIANELSRILQDNKTEDRIAALSIYQSLSNIQAKMFSSYINVVTKDDLADMKVLNIILHSWVTAARGGKVKTESGLGEEKIAALFQQKLSVGFSQLLKLSRAGRLLVLDVVATMEDTTLPADPEILSIVERGWHRFRNHRRKIRDQMSRSGDRAVVFGQPGEQQNLARSIRKDNEATAAEGLALLYALVIFQLYNEDAEAVSILEELMAFEDDQAQSIQQGDRTLENADGLVEILLSFASRPSKFLRRFTMDIFEAFTSQISRQGLTSLVDVLQTKETRQGQDELFEANGTEQDDENAANSDSDMDVDNLDSDVEIIDVKRDSVSTTSNSVSSSEDGSDSERSSTPSETSSDADSNSTAEESEAVNEELEALERSLASALGTRKITADDVAADTSSSDESDSDMDDDAMLTLDAKLSEVFRTRAAAQSKSKTKQKENKSAKENMANFKNRVLDMVDIYIKNEAASSNIIALVLPLLILARSTTVKQLSIRAIELVKSMCNHCKGLHNAPVLDKSSPKSRKQSNGDTSSTQSGNDAAWAMGVFTSIHEEVCLQSSNAHKMACSQASILLAKTLLKANVDIGRIIAAYTDTQIKMLTDAEAGVQEVFFRDWIVWCGSVRGKINRVEESKVVDLPNSVRDTETEEKSERPKVSKKSKKRNKSNGSTLV